MNTKPLLNNYLFVFWRETNQVRVNGCVYCSYLVSKVNFTLVITILYIDIYFSLSYRLVQFVSCDKAFK